MAMDSGMYTKAVSANNIDNNDGTSFVVGTITTGAKPGVVENPMPDGVSATLDASGMKKAVVANAYDNGGQQIINGELNPGGGGNGRINAFNKNHDWSPTTYWNMTTGQPDGRTAIAAFMWDSGDNNATDAARDDAVPNGTVDKGELTIAKQNGPSSSDY